jgi:hypothetical protein
MDGNFKLSDIQAMAHRTLLDSLSISAQSIEAAKIAKKMPEMIERLVQYGVNVPNMTAESVYVLWARQILQAASDLAVSAKIEGQSQKVNELEKIVEKMSAALGSIERHEIDTRNMTQELLSRVSSRNASWVRQIVTASRDLAIIKKTEGHHQKAEALEKFIKEMSDKLLNRMAKFAQKKSVTKRDKS